MLLCQIENLKQNQTQEWLKFNTEMSKTWSVIKKVKDPLPTYEEAANYTDDENWSKVSRIPAKQID